MDVATALLIILSHAGYWVGGQEQTVELRWGLDAPMPAAVVRWDLSVAGTILVQGETPLPAGDGKAQVTLHVPIVRQPIAAKFRFRASMVDGGRELLAGEQAVQLHPNNLGALAALTADRPLLVVDAPDKLPAILTEFNATFDQVESVGKLVAAKQQTIVVGQERLSADDPAASVLTALANRGASIIILRQATATRILQYDVALRDASGFTVDRDHALLRHLGADAWTTLFSEPTARQPTLAVPADAPVLAIIHSPFEADNVSNAPVDALLVTRTVGAGRIVICQLPMDDLRTDARQQLLLLNLIEYARTRPQPTPPRDTQKPTTKPAPAVEQPSIYGR